MRPSELQCFQRRIVLRDGSRVLIRALTPADAAKLLKFYSSLSTETSYLRFLNYRPSSSWVLEGLANVNFEDNVALGAFTEKGELIGDARFSLDRKTGRAEIGIVVADEWQGRGLGLNMIQTLGYIALRMGVKTLYATVSPVNYLVAAALKSAGFRRVRAALLEERIFEADL
ncbi:MAG: GNAT family N-acetyltransferase [Candidatus Jordarchaeales archaeon]